MQYCLRINPINYKYSGWFELLFRNYFEMVQMQVPVHPLHTLGALMVTVSTPRGVIETMTVQIAVMKSPAQVRLKCFESYIQNILMVSFTLGCSSILN